MPTTSAPSWSKPCCPIRAHGTIATYSSIGFDLLADAIEVAGSQSYPELLRTRVTEPLGMTDTGVAPTLEQCARLMVGSGVGGSAPCGDTHATDGSGGLYSTVAPVRHGRLRSAVTAVYRRLPILRQHLFRDEILGKSELGFLLDGMNG